MSRKVILFIIAALLAGVMLRALYIGMIFIMPNIALGALICILCIIAFKIK